MASSIREATLKDIDQLVQCRFIFMEALTGVTLTEQQKLNSTPVLNRQFTE